MNGYQITHFIGTDGVPVIQIDTAERGGMIRVNLNDAPIYTGSPEIHDAPGISLIPAARDDDHQERERPGKWARGLRIYGAIMMAVAAVFATHAVVIIASEAVSPVALIAPLLIAFWAFYAFLVQAPRFTVLAKSWERRAIRGEYLYGATGERLFKTE